MVANAPGKPSSIKNCTRLLEAIRIAMGKILANTDSLVSLVPSLDEIGVPFEDQFQLPLRPAEDNLSCAVYHTFEKQVDKYVAYRNAIFEAVTDLYDAGVCASSNPPVVFVVGAGRGGLIERVFEAEQQLLEIRTASKPKQWTILAIEKNPFAALSLETSNRQR